MTEKECGKDLGFVVLGALGQQGKNGLNALAKVFRELEKRGARPHLLALVDKRPATPEDKKLLQRLFEKQHDVTPHVTRITDSIQLFRTEFGPNPPILVFDATPTTVHTQNLAFLIDLHKSYDADFYYLGEKPIFADPGNDFEDPPGELAWATTAIPSDFKFFCELVELANPAYLACKNLLSARNLRIEEILLWRAGSSAIKKIAGIDRDGVMGGALEDKSLHDFSISVGLLGLNQVHDVRITGVSGSGHFCVSPSGFWSDQFLLLTRNNGEVPIRGINLNFRDSWPADSVTSVEAVWALEDGRRVPAKYLFSWVGTTSCALEQQFRSTLHELGIIDFVGENNEPGNDCSCNVQEVRIGMFRCIDSAGKTKWVVANFLSKGRQFAIRRYLRLVDEETGHIEDIPIDESEAATYASLKKDEMASLMMNIAECAIGDREYADIVCGRPMTMIVHRAMLLVQQRVRSGLQDLCGSPAKLEAACNSSMTLAKRKVRY